MKRLIAVIAALVLFLSLGSICFAEERDYVGELVDTLPEDVGDKLPEGLRGENAKDMLTYDYMLKESAEGARSALYDVTAPLASLIGLLVLSALLNRVGALHLGEKIYSFISSSVILLALCEVIIPLFELVRSTMFSVGTVIRTALPIMTAVSAASGNAASSAVNSTWLLLLIELLELLCEAIIMPLLSLCLGFMAVSVLAKGSGSPDLSGISSVLKKSAVFILSLVGTVLSAVMAYQTVIAKSADSIALRSIKFASGSFIPVVGGALGEAADTYLAGISAATGGVGAVTVISVALIVLPVIFKLIFWRIGLSFVSLTASILGCDRESVAIKEASETVGLALGLVSAAAVMLTVTILVFINTRVW